MIYLNTAKYMYLRAVLYEMFPYVYAFTAYYIFPGNVFSKYIY